MSRVFPAALAAVVSLTVLGLSTMSTAIVDPGHVGVVTHFGAVQDASLPEGLHFVVPIRTQVVPIDVRVQKLETRASASSRDLQNVSSVVALNFLLSRDHAPQIFRTLGPSYANTILAPAIQESVKSVTARYTAEELITRRPEVKSEIFAALKQRLVKNHIEVSEFSIVDFKFSAEFNRAIEDKQVAEQAALRAKNDLSRIETEAKQARARAVGEAEAQLALARSQAESQRLLKETLTPDLIQLRALEKWDGALPQVSCGGAGTGFIDVVAAAQGLRGSAALSE